MKHDIEARVIQGACNLATQVINYQSYGARFPQIDLQIMVK